MKLFAVCATTCVVAQPERVHISGDEWLQLGLGVVDGMLSDEGHLARCVSVGIESGDKAKEIVDGIKKVIHGDITEIRDIVDAVQALVQMLPDVMATCGATPHDIQLFLSSLREIHNLKDLIDRMKEHLVDDHQEIFSELSEAVEDFKAHNFEMVGQHLGKVLHLLTIGEYPSPTPPEPPVPPMPPSPVPPMPPASATTTLRTTTMMDPTTTIDRTTTMMDRTTTPAAPATTQTAPVTTVAPPATTQTAPATTQTAPATTMAPATTAVATTAAPTPEPPAHHYIQQIGLNCYEGRGASGIDDSPLAGVDNLDDCLLRCDESPECEGVVVPNQGGQLDCYRRANLDASQCEVNDMWTLFSKAPEGFSVYQGVNCYDGMGASGIDETPVPDVATLDDCIEKCNEVGEECEGVMYPSNGNNECYRRGGLNLQECAQDAAWVMYARSSVPAKSTVALHALVV